MNLNKDKRQENIESLITGDMQYSGDLINEVKYNYLYPVVSPIASGKLLSIDFSKAEKMDGYICSYTAKDIPGKNAIGAVSREEEPLLAIDELNYVGQPVGFVICKTQSQARLAAKKVVVKVEEDNNEVLTVEDAIKKECFYCDPLVISSGNIEKEFSESYKIIEGEFRTGGQEHAYLETQRAFAQFSSFKKSILIHCGTQAITDIQEVVALNLGLNNNSVEVDVYRVGGAFGGKERGGTMWAAMAALALEKTKRPCGVVLDRSDDLIWTGKRHPYYSKYKLGIDINGKIKALETYMYADGGYYEDFTFAIMERAILGLCNGYYFESSHVVGYCCKTNLPANTAFRGFGAPQATLLMEEMIYQISFALDKDVSVIQRCNFLQNGDKTHYGMEMQEVALPEMYDKLMCDIDYKKLRLEVDSYNNSHKFSKKGIGIVPVKYGIGFTATFLNQGNALVYVYTDGSVSISHGGIEMGQGLFTKLELIVAEVLQISPDKVSCESTNSLRAGSVASTAASTGTDINGAAAKIAALKIKESLTTAASMFLKENHNLEPAEKYITFKDGFWWDERMGTIKNSFETLASYCYFNRYNMGAQGHYATPGLKYDPETGKGTPFSYFTNGVCLSTVTVDTLTGSYIVDKVAIKHEGGHIIDYAIDRGQVLGGFIQGMGFVTMEELPHAKNGVQLASSFSTYKVPLINDLPKDFSLDLYESDNKLSAVLGSKGVGEPPLNYGVAVFNAIRDSIGATAKGQRVLLNQPATPMEVLLTIKKLKSISTGC